MNEQLENAVVQILERAISGIDSSVGFMQAELPDVIEQLLTWYLVKGFITATIDLLFTIPLIILIKLYLKQDIKGATESSFWVNYRAYGDNELSGALAVAFGSAFFVAGCGLGSFFSSIFEPLQIWIAPKIWLMEYAASLVK